MAVALRAASVVLQVPAEAELAHRQQVPSIPLATDLRARLPPDTAVEEPGSGPGSLPLQPWRVPILWLNPSYKPAWVDLQLTKWDAGMRRGSPLLGYGGGGACMEAKCEEDLDVGTLTEIVKDSELREAVGALDLLVRRGAYVARSLFYHVLKKCMAQQNLVIGRLVHDLSVKCGYGSNAFLVNHIILMYASHGRLEEAMQAFTNMADPDCYMWSSVILAYARDGQVSESLKLYRQMKQSKVEPDNHVFAAVLKACASGGDLEAGKEVHADILKRGNELNTFVGSCLVDMYAKCRSLPDARALFDNLSQKDVVTWTAMMVGYVQQGFGQEALALYVSMQQESKILPNRMTFSCLLQACGSTGALHIGKQLHSQINTRGLQADVVVGNCLVDMYVKCGSLEDARRVFDKLPTKDVVTWTAMIAGYAQHGLGQEALSLYKSMQQCEVSPADHVTFVCLVQACASIGDLHQGKQLHAQIQEKSLEGDIVVGSCLVDMYAKCGCIEEAREVFDRLSARNVVTWTGMLAGYAQQGLGQEALALYESMKGEGVIPTDHTFVCLLQACASVGAIVEGKELHEEIKARGLEGNLFVGNSLVDMYAKCGSLGDARSVFDTLPTRDVVTWNALLNGYAEHSDGQMAIECFEEMCEHGVELNDTTFICLLVACSHAGMVDEGQRYFRMMVEDHGIVPSEQHYNCMVDLLGRSGRLDEAESILQNHAFENDVTGWKSLLSACQSHGDVQRGRRCFDHLITLEPENASPYVVFAKICANAGMWRDVDRIQSLRMSAGAKKKPAKASIEVKKKVHEFIVGAERYDILPKVKSLHTRLREEGGHVPQTELVLKSVSEQEKEDALCGHAEKLALAYGLLNTPDGTTLLVTKNLRMCNDCHSSTKVMSHLEKREIIVRDAHRVHHFVEGSCSCGDRH